MRLRIHKLLATSALVASAMFSVSTVSAAPVTCPNPLTGTQDNTYTVDPAIDCVWGTGNIGQGNPANDAFLTGTGTNDAAYGNSGPTFGKTWTLVGANSTPTGSITGITFSNVTGTTADWTITDSAYGFYALGVKDGEEPPWAVFLIDGSTGTSGTVSMIGGSFSHFALYGSGTPDGNGGGSLLPEPATLGLLGVGMLALGALRRRKH